MVTKYQVHLYSKRVVEKLVKDDKFRSEHLVIRRFSTDESLVLLHEKMANLHNRNEQLLNELSSSIADTLMLVDEMNI